MKIHFLFLFALTIFFTSCNQSGDKKPHKTIIAFGSCSHEFDSIQMWDNVMVHQPKAWIWMGDNIYGDTEDMAVMKTKYDLQKQRPSYQNLKNATEIYGIWDDHDYGINDGGKEYAMKDESKKLMLGFLDVSKENDVWNRSGGYQSYLIRDNNLKIKLILLDTRYFRDTMKINLSAPPLYHPNTQGAILGEQQWHWFENELTNSAADVHLIGSSIQVIPNEHGYEKWGNFPQERKRLFDLIVKTNPARPIILSGDRHIAEFSKIELDGLEYPLYEFTSSGLTHTWGSARPEPNQYRIGDLIIKKNFGTIQVEHGEKSIEVELMVYGSENEVLHETVAYF